MTRGPSDYGPTASWSALQLRANLLRRARAFFDERGFLEVETPVLSADVVVDRHLDPFGTILCDDPRRPEIGRKLWLQTSPEFHMKRLLAAGATAIYQLARVFRNAERGALHNPEFTMLEWYRAGDDLHAGMTLLDALSQELLARGAAERVTYREAFERYVGLDPHTASVEELRQAAVTAGVSTPESFTEGDRDAWLDLLLVERVQPRLGVEAAEGDIANCKLQIANCKLGEVGTGRPVMLYEFPASQAALARVRDDDPPVAERFELYVDGVELANGYHELLDAQVLRERNRANNELRHLDGKPALPEQSRLLSAMDSGLPACAGTALGFDRLVMLAAGATTIDEVVAFPIDRA